MTADLRLPARLRSLLPAVALTALAARVVPAQESITVIADVTLQRTHPVGYASLQRGAVYRVEVRPVGARIELRLRTSYRPPPLRPYPATSVPPGAEAFTVVPSVSGQYFIERADSSAMVTVRVVLDPAELSAPARERADRVRPPLVGLGVKLVATTPFRDCDSTGSWNCGGLGDAPAYGIEACLAVVPLGARSIHGAGGCAVSVGAYQRSDGRDYLTIGVAPRLRIVPAGAAGGLSIVSQLAFGRPNRNLGFRANRYTFLSLGLAGSLDSEGSIEAEIAVVRLSAVHTRATDTFLRFSIGATLHRRASVS